MKEEKEVKKPEKKKERASISGLLSENEKQITAAEDIANAKVTDIESILEQDEKEAVKKKAEKKKDDDN